MPQILKLNPECDLRAELAAAIEIGRAADDAAERAIGVASTAERLMREASEEVERLRIAQKEAEQLTTERRAKAITEAIRAGSDLPHPPLPAPADAAPLAAALASLNALELAAAKLAAERDTARAEAAAAAQTVHRLVDAIITGDARDLAAELIASTEHNWALFDRLAGVIRLDESRPDGPTLRELQDEVITGIDRWKSAIAKNRLMIERHNFNEQLTDTPSLHHRRRTHANSGGMVAGTGYQRNGDSCSSCSRLERGGGCHQAGAATAPPSHYRVCHHDHVAMGAAVGHQTRDASSPS